MVIRNSEVNNKWYESAIYPWGFQFTVQLKELNCHYICMVFFYYKKLWYLITNFEQLNLLEFYSISHN